MKLIEELRKRDLIFNATPNIEKFFEKKGTLYMGIDPTSNGLHLGNFLGLSLLKRFLLNGFKVIIILGGGTAKIGDPSGKIKERPILPLKTLEKNKKQIIEEIKNFLNFPASKLKIIDNSLWLDKLSLMNFLRDVGKFISINSMLDLEVVKNRIETREFMSFAEFSYQLLQAYDFLVLYQKYKCELQIGGSDQWGNIIQGIELIKKKLNKEAYGLVYPLLVDPKTGRKFGKTESGETLWLNLKKTHPFKIYQFIINTDDEMAKKMLFYFSFKTLDEIENLIKESERKKEERLIQKELAKEIILTLHGDEVYKMTEQISHILFEKKFEEINEREIKIIKPALPFLKVNKNYNLDEILVSLGLSESKSEAKNLIKNKAIQIREIKNYLLIKKGKKHFGLVEIN